MILSQLRYAPIPKQVSAAIPHIGDEPPIIGAINRGHQGCAHARHVRVRLRLLQDDAVGLGDGSFQVGFRALPGRCIVLAKQRFDGQLAGHLPRGMPAHAVRHREQMAAFLQIGIGQVQLLPPIQDHTIGILVVGANLAGMRPRLNRIKDVHEPKYITNVGENLALWYDRTVPGLPAVLKIVLDLVDRETGNQETGWGSESARFPGFLVSWFTGLLVYWFTRLQDYEATHLVIFIGIGARPRNGRET